MPSLEIIAISTKFSNFYTSCWETSLKTSGRLGRVIYKTPLVYYKDDNYYFYFIKPLETTVDTCLYLK